jgi:hypothetical protein
MGAFLFRHLAILIFAIFITVSANAQNLKSFTPDSITFIKEISEFFITARKKEGEDFMKKEFLPVFYSGRFSEKDKQKIYRTCNIMLKKRMKPFPDFKNYLITMVGFLDSKQSEESFEAWQISLEKIIENSTSKKFVDFLSFSGNLFAENILYQSNTVIWYTDNDRYRFEYDSLPYLIFSSLNLKCESKGDSSVIYKTAGKLYPTEGKWVGNGGIVNWKRTGFEDDVHAELSDYQIGLKTPSFTADSVLFHYRKYFEKPLLGKLEEKVQPNVTDKTALYPRFESYHKRFLIKNLVEEVDYDGGFSMVGSKFIGSGNEEENAMLIFYQKDEPFMVAASKTFVIREDRITSDRSSITIFIENDSIFHPGLNFKIFTKNREVTMYRDGKGMSRSPYYNTFHNIDMDVEVINWKMGEPLMNMEVLKGTTQTKANFQSNNFYSGLLYNRLWGMDRTHPLVLIFEASQKYNSRELFAEEIARHMRFPMEQVSPMLLDLSTQGFLLYDVDKKKVILKDKLYSYLEANAQKRDYDVIEFNSDITGQANATLNLLNFNLIMRGVDQISLSDSQNVFIRPTNQTITMKKNRDFEFGGIVNAGLFDLFGPKFSFEYDNFKINLISVDSLRIKINVGEKDMYGRYQTEKIKTVIEDIQGDLLIDGPNNKSGNKSLNHYPILNSRKDSYVYYNKRSIQQGVYPKDKFYFKVYPFTIDSLNNFETNAIAMEGMFSSAGIFPDFEEKLRIQEDFSLGFKRMTPPGGYPIYGNKSTFENEISLSHEGLRGNGDLKYVTSTAKSNNFLFYPDSTNAIMQEYTIEGRRGGNIEFPDVSATGAYMHYRPYDDIMEVYKQEKPISIFNGTVAAHGSVYLRPSGLTGKGFITFFEAEMDANKYTFKHHEILSDTADFRLAVLEAQQFALKSNNVKAHIDFEARKGEFVSNGGATTLQFPFNQYMCYIDRFNWLMDNDDIELTGGDNLNIKDPNRADLDLTGSQFISTHPKQDSLTYYSSKSRYDLKNYVIYSSNVKYINAADAMIYPYEGEVVIDRGAKMRTFNNSIIKANNVTQYHEIYNATVNIFGRKSYEGSGYYDYKSEDGRIQTIIFEKITQDTTGGTIGDGLIPDTSGFALSTFFDFKGKVKLFAADEYLTFDGLCRINHDCEKMPRNWMKFKSEINPNEIFIPVSLEPTSENNIKMATGLMLANDSIGVYSAFLSAKHKNSDATIVGAEGFLFFDKPSQEFRISNKEKIKETILLGNYISLNTRDCKFYGEGKLNLGVELGNIKLSSAGAAYHNLNDNQALFDMILNMNFFIDDGALDKMAETMNKNSSGEAIDYSRQIFEKSLRELYGQDDADKLIGQLLMNGGSFRKFPNEFNHTFNFTDVKFKWNEEAKAYRSMGKIGLANINKNQIHKYFDGHIEIAKKRGGDILNVFIDLGGTWYFLNYQRNILQVISSNEEFNNIIQNIKPDKKKYKPLKGEAPFQFTISTVKKKNDFLRKLETSSGEE